MNDNFAKERATALSVELYGSEGLKEVEQLLNEHGGNWSAVWGILLEARKDNDRKNGYLRF